MKKVISYLLISFCGVITYAQNVGIGTTTPKARLHVSDSSVVFSAADPFLAVPGNTPVNGAGARMMWYPGKAAFRTGYIDGTQWDKDYIGFFSFASGYSVSANNLYSTAMGRNTIASGTSSTALGYFTIASGSNSTAFGAYNQATGIEATAMNSNTIAPGYASTSMGFATNAKADYSIAAGSYTKSMSPSSVVIGQYNDTTNTNRLFEIGNGTADNLRSNAMTVLTSGNIGIGTTTPGFPLNFQSTLGDKIALYGNSGNHYGFGIQGSLMQIHSDLNNSNIAFGYGSSSSFTERMRIINSGADGVSIYGRMVLRNGTFPLDPAFGTGIWMYKADNTSALGFMGVQNNQNLGFFGGPSGWGFTYDAVNSRVGIGNNNPNAPLAFPNVTGKKITLYPSAAGNYGFGVYNSELRIHSDNPGAIISFGQENQAGTFTERARIINGGVDGLSLKGRLVISNGLSTDLNPGIMFTTLDNSVLNTFIGLMNSDDYLGFYSYRGAGWAFAMNTINGNIGMGTMTPTQKLHVVGNIYATGTITPSDIRFKKDIETIHNPIEKINQLNGVTYHYRYIEFKDLGFTDKEQVGVIAQEVEKVLPQLVFTDDKGYKAVDYSKLVPLLIEGIKEQQKQIETSNSKVDKLNQELVELKRLMEQLLKK